MRFDKKMILRIFLGIAGLIVLHWLLHEPERFLGIFNFLKTLLMPFIIGASLAFVLNVPMRGIERWFGGVKNATVRRGIAIVLTFIFIAIVLAFVFWMLLPQIISTVDNLIEKLPVFLNGVRYKVEDFLAEHPDVLQWLMENTKFNEFDWTSYIKQIVDFATNSVQSLITNLFGMIKALFSGIFNAVVALVFAVYCLIRKEILSRQARRLIYSFLPEKFCDQLVRVARLTNASFSNFISGQCLEAVILGAMFAVAMLIFRMPYIPLVSVLIAVTALVPIVGAFAGCILGAFFILVDNPIQAVWFVVMFLVLQQIEGNLIYPRVVGKSVGLPGMWVLLAVSIGGELMGVAGMLIMIPLCSVLYTLLREITAKRLDKRCIDNAKLMDQPSPVLNRLAENHKKTKKKKAFRKKSQEVKQIREESQSESE